MTATDELRRMLDERGVEYEVDDAKTVKVTRWKAYCEWVSFIEYDNGDTKFCIDARRLTPEQAVEATLGRGTCQLKPWEMERDTGFYDCMECACGYVADVADWAEWHYCPNCGRKVVGE